MIRLDVRFLPAALDDIDNLYRFIASEVHAPLAADRYVDGIYDIIFKLEYLGAAIAPSRSNSVQSLYGPDARTINYKKMTIIYNVVGRYVIVRRVVAGSLIR
jgi:plasmid stabilization system protein ParE